MVVNCSVFYAGICFCFATLAKWTMIIYPGALTLLAWIYYGQSSALIFAFATAGVIIISNLIEWKFGFWDAQSLKQIKTRMATTLRITKTKFLHFSIWFEIVLLIKQALPIWIGGITALALFLAKEEISVSYTQLTLPTKREV